MNEAEKLRIKTDIEKKVHELVCITTKDHIRDFVMIVAMKNSLPVERQSLEALIKVMESAVDDSFRRNIDVFVDKIMADTEKYSSLVEDSTLKARLDTSSKEKA